MRHQANTMVYICHGEKHLENTLGHLHIAFVHMPKHAHISPQPLLTYFVIEIQDGKYFHTN